MLAPCEFDEFEVFPDRRQVRKNGALVPLGARAFDLLACLIEHRERVVAKEELLEAVWPALVVTENNLNVQIRALRRVFGPKVALTVSGRGFRFGPEIRVVGAASRQGNDRRQQRARRGQAAETTAMATPAALATHALPDKPSIAVLPFLSLGSNPRNSPLQQEDFADGITEDITTELSRFKSLFVISRNSAFTYKGRAVDVRTVSSELGVQYVLEGSVRQSGARVRVTAQLIDALTGKHLWAEKYDRVVEEAFDIQEELTLSIVSAMAPQIATFEGGKARSARPGNLNAYGLALRSSAIQRLHGMSGDRVAFAEALALAHRAIALDPESGFAWRVLAGALWLQIYYNVAADLPANLGQALEACTRAITRDGTDHFAHTLKGLLSFMAGQPATGLAELRRAHEINPNDAYTLCWLAFYESTYGDAGLAVAYGSQALRRSPRDPMRHGFLLLLAGVHFSVADYASSLDYASRSLLEAPNTAGPHVAMAISWVGLGKIDAANSAFQIAQQIGPDLVQARLAGTWASPGSNFHLRAHLFFRVAAGVEAPAAAMRKISAGSV